MKASFVHASDVHLGSGSRTGRRQNLAQVIPRAIQGFGQLFVIGHDDTFDAMTENVIRVVKDGAAGSRVEVG